ncbi:hypothetical protein LguiA_034728 [Lonicera macranthoides]
MIVAGAIHGGSSHPSKFHILSAKIQTQKKLIKPSPPPIFISTNPTHVNPFHLRDLFSLCNHSSHRFPNLLPDGKVEPVDVHKLRLALSHSSVVVSVFAKLDEEEEFDSDGGGDWFRRLMPVSPVNGRLVGFGRAVSDSGFTASIYDVTVNT